MVKSAAKIKAEVAASGRQGGRRYTLSSALRKPSRRVTPTMSNDIAINYTKHAMSIRQCAAAADIAYGTARRALLRAGVQLRQRGGS